MTWLMPTELIPIAAILGLVMVWPRLEAPTSSWRMFGEVFLSILAAIALWAVLWALYWNLEQRW